MSANSPKEKAKKVLMLDPDQYATGSDLGSVSNEVDTFGYRYAEIIFAVGDTDTSWAVQVQSSNTSGSGHADVTGATFTMGATDDNTFKTGVIDLRTTSVSGGVGRYLLLDGTSSGGANTDAAAFCLLWNPRDTRNDLTLGGAAGAGDEPDFEIY